MPNDPKSKSKPKAKRPTRKNSGYDNSLRQKRSENNQKLIIQTMVQLLVEKRGREITFSEIAKKTGLAERSIYRFFKDKEALYKETDQYVSTHLAEAIHPIKGMSILGFGRNSYAVLDRNEPLAIAYVYSQFGEEARRVFRKSLNGFVIEKIKQEKQIQIVNSDMLKKMALIASLVNAKIWHDIKSDFGFTGEEMGDAVEWALKVLIDHL